MGGGPLQAEEGGPIGLRATGLVARVLMDYWAAKLKEMAERTQTLHALNPVKFEPLTIHLIRKYVDDILLAMGLLRRGTRWSPKEGALVWDHRWEEEDKGESQEVLTMRVVCSMATSVLNCLKNSPLIVQQARREE